MRTILNLGLSVLLLCFLGLTATFAQTPPPAREQPRNEDAEIKAAQERLKKLIAEIAEQEARKSQAPKVEPPKAATPNDPAIGALEKLAKSSDPKVAALAKELLAAMKHTAPGGDGKFLFQFDDGGPGPKLAGPFELKFDNLQFDIQPDGSMIKGQPKVVVVGDAKTPGAPAVGGSTLKMSADGKTAAVVGADGSITIYDVATGKEQMRFPGKR